MAILASFPFKMDRREEFSESSILDLEFAKKRLEMWRRNLQMLKKMKEREEREERLHFLLKVKSLKKHVQMQKMSGSIAENRIIVPKRNLFGILGLHQLGQKIRQILGLEFESPQHLMEKIYEDISKSRNIVEMIQKEKENMEDLVQIWEFLKTDITDDYKSEEDSGLKTGIFSREKLLMTFLTMIMFISHFLSMFISSRCKKRYVLLWTDKAVLLVLWTCGDVELNPGPNETNPAKARSQILREFRRSSQTMLLELMYKTWNKNMPVKPYSYPPPGWDEYKPEVKFENISNLRSGEGKVFTKMIYLLKNSSPMPLSSEWGVLLGHYDNLNTKGETEESKKALEIWILEKKLIPALQEYSKHVDDPSVVIKDICKAILQKSASKDKPVHPFDTKKNDGKTHPKIYAEYRQSDGEGVNDEVLSSELFNSRERPESEIEISARASRSNHQHVEHQSVEIPYRSQVLGKRKRRTEESTSAAGKKLLKRDKKCLVQSQEKLNENFQFIVENHDGDTKENTDDQCIQARCENVDPTMHLCNNHFVESDHDRLQVSSSKDNFGEIINKETLHSNNLPGKEKQASDTCDELIHADDTLDDLLTNQCTTNMKICSNELGGDQAENPLCKFLDEKTLDELSLGLYEPGILTMYLERYLKDLGNGRPSSRIAELCKEILNKEHISNACNTDANCL